MTTNTVIVYSNNPDGTDVNVCNIVKKMSQKELNDFVAENFGDKFGVTITIAPALPTPPAELLGAMKLNIDDKKLVFDMDRAKSIWKDSWRAARAPLLAKLDVEYIQALEKMDTLKMSQIADKKQALRDVTNIDIVASTPTDILCTWPSILNSDS
jgi:hypothetical protein